MVGGGGGGGGAHRRQVAHHEEGGEGGVKEEGDPFGGCGWDAQAADAGGVGCRREKMKRGTFMTDRWENRGDDLTIRLRCDDEPETNPTKRVFLQPFC